MKKLAVCFVGIGSIARRHIKNLRKICEERKIELSIDAVRRSKILGKEDEVLHLRKIYTTYNEVDIHYDIAFITNPTEYHLDALAEVNNWAKHFFIEKPFTSMKQLHKMENINFKEESIYYVACPLRYNAVIQYIKNKVDFSKVFSVRSISSSYLPEWRPGTDYRNSYSAYKSLGGGVSIDLIHEWDYLTYLLGMPEKVYSFMGKNSRLEIDSEDYAVYIASYADKIAELHLDYFGRKIIREIMIFMEDDTLCGNIAENRIEFMKEGRILEFNESRDDFQMRELEHFLHLIEENRESDSSVQHAVSVLNLTQGRI